MPVKPENKGRYPANWPEIRQRILKRDGNRCKFCGAENYQPHPVTGSKVILTIAHLNGNPEDNRDGNLAALCQRDHLAWDRRHRKSEKGTCTLRR